MAEWFFFFVVSSVVEWYSYFTKVHKGVAKFHKGLDMLQFSLEFSLCLLSWRSDIFSLWFLCFFFFVVFVVFFL